MNIKALKYVVPHGRKSALVFSYKPEVDQGVVTYILPVEAIATGIKIFDRPLDHLIFYGSKVKL